MVSHPTRTPFLPDDDWAILRQACQQADVPAEVVERMIAEESKVYGMGRRHGIKEALERLVIEGAEGGSSQGASHGH
jgi:hypothetical protein